MVQVRKIILTFIRFINIFEVISLFCSGLILAKLLVEMSFPI